MTKEIDGLKKCLKNKEKRIRKLENYFWIRNRIVLSIGATVLIFSPIIILFLFAEPLPDNAVHYLVVDIFAIIGAMFVVACEFLGWIWVMGKIWSGVFER